MSPRPLVLVVDDEPGVRAVLVRQVEHFGYEAVPADTGAKAVAVCGARPPAAAVLDVRMLELDGPATLDALRAVLPGRPCVFVSGDPRPHTVPDLLARGAALFLPKPFRLAQIEATLAALVPARTP